MAQERSSGLSRRGVLSGAAAATGLLSGALKLRGDEPPVATRGNIRQSVCHWCFAKYWTPEQLARTARALGCVSVELIDPKHWPMLKRYGLTCAISSSHPFKIGLNNPAHHEQCLTILRQRIEQAAAFGCPNVITFTGFAEGISPDVGARNCVEGFKKIIGFAEEKGVNLCLEMLNSRATGEMKGHPGYQGDHTEYCIDIVKRVGSPRMKLLFDLYHVQIMDGDVVTRIRQHKDYIGHIHTAGVPGRRELDAQQENNYPALMRALVEVGYTGYVGHEFMPTRDPLDGLREAVRVCDV